MTRPDFLYELFHLLQRSWSELPLPTQTGTIDFTEYRDLLPFGCGHAGRSFSVSG